MLINRGFSALLQEISIAKIQNNQTKLNEIFHELQIAYKISNWQDAMVVEKVKKDYQGCTLLYFALQCRQSDAVIYKLMQLNNSYNEVYFTGQDSFYPIHLAVQAGMLDLLYRIFGQYSQCQFANDLLEQKDGRGRTALCWAVENDQIEIVQYLLKKGANPNITYFNADGKLTNSILDLALEKKNNVCISLLVQAGATLRKIGIFKTKCHFFATLKFDFCKKNHERDHAQVWRCQSV